MKQILVSVLVLLLAGCTGAPTVPRAIVTPAPETEGILQVRAIGPLVTFPLGMLFPLTARDLDLVVANATGREVARHVEPITIGGTFADAELQVPAGDGLILNVTLTDDQGGVLATAQAASVSVRAGQYTRVQVALQPTFQPVQGIIIEKP